MNFLFPTIKIEAPQKELVQAYRCLLLTKAPTAVLPFTLAFCAIVAGACTFALGISPFFAAYLLPTILIALLSVLTVLAKRYFNLGAISFLLAIGNLVLAIGPLLLFHPYQKEGRSIALYYLLLLISFVWIIVEYRLHYKKFENITYTNAKKSIQARTQPRKSIFWPTLGTAILASLIVNTFAPWIIGAACVLLGGYYAVPLVANQFIIVRQYNQMEPHLQEYAGEENEPEA